MCEYLNSNGQHVVVCVWGGVLVMGGLCLWLLSLTGLGRRSVISPSYRHTVLLLRLTSESPSPPLLLSSPSSLWLSSPSLPPLLRRFPGRFGAVVFHMQGANRLDGYCSSVTSTPPPHTHTQPPPPPWAPFSSLPQILFYPFTLKSFLSGLLLTFPSPPLPPLLRFAPPWLHLTAQVCLACRRLLRPGASKGQCAQRQETRPHW